MIKKELEKLPEGVLAEVFDFIQFLELKREKKHPRKSLSRAIYCVVPKDMGQQRGCCLLQFMKKAMWFLSHFPLAIRQPPRCRVRLNAPF